MESVVSQSPPPLEYIIMDDASTDGSVEIMESFAAKFRFIRVIRNDANRGIFNNIERLVGEVKGRYLLNLSADDKLASGYFAAAEKILSQHPDSGVCFGDNCIFSDDGKARTVIYGFASQPCEFDRADAPRLIAAKGHFPGPCLYNLTALRAIGGFNRELRWLYDSYAQSAIAMRFGFCYLPQLCSYVRISPASYSATEVRGKRTVEVFRKVLAELGRDENEDIASGFKAANALAHYWTGWECLVAMRETAAGRRLITPGLLGRLLGQSLWKLACRLTPSDVRSKVGGLLRK